MKKINWVGEKVLPFCRWKIILIMKLQLIFLLGFIIQVNATVAQTQLKRLNVQFENKTLKEALGILEEKTDYSVIYKDELLSSDHKYSETFQNEMITDILDNLLKNQNLTYTIRGRVIVILPKDELNGLEQQKIPVKGTVKNEQGEPIPGVTVVIKGTTTGTITDVDGNYEIVNVAEYGVLVFSFVGMKTQEVDVAGQSNIDIVLQNETIGLNEVVAIGYGQTTKKDLTGSVSTVSAKDFERVPATDPLQALQGRASGLQITSNSGMPGAGSSVLIRGVQSINGSNSPIYVVDGIITSNINNIAPNDIESASVLKDASATAIYGARAANGVVVITTKRGTSKKDTEISLNSYVGLQTQSNLRLNLLNAQEYLNIYTEAYNNAGITLPWAETDMSYYNGVNTDWIGAITRTGVIQNHELSVTGGSEKSNYYVSASYMDNKGMVLGSNYKRYQIRFNSDHKIKDWIHFGNSLNIYSSETNGINSLFHLAALKVPLTRVYDANGDYAKIHDTSLEHMFINPVWQANETVKRNDSKGLQGNMYLTLDLLKGLKFTTRGNAEWNYQYLTAFTPGLDPSYQWAASTKNLVRKEGQQDLHWTTDFLLDYDKTIAENHKFKVLLGYSLEDNVYENLWGSRSDTPNNNIRYLDAGDPTTQLNGNTTTDWAFESFFGRLNYNYKDKYLFTGTLRRDGTSRLSTANRNGVFPSASVAWRMTQEDFMKDIGFLDDFKLRGSWGAVGNVLSIGNYGTIATLDQWNYVFNNEPAQGYTLASAVNKDLKWESTIKKNIGFDAAFFNNQLYGSFDYFIEDTKDLLFHQPLPESTGLSGSPYINAGKVRNSGYEFEVGYRKKVNDWSYDINLNASHVKNEVIDLEGRDLRTSGIQEGYPVNSFFGYETNGLIYTQDQLNNYPHMSGKQIGDIWIKDVNGVDANGNLTGKPDGQITSADRIMIGRKYPNLIYGFMGTINYKNWGLQVQLQGVQGVDRSILGNDYVLSRDDYVFGVFHYFTSLPMNHDRLILDRYNAEKNPTGSWPRVSVSDTGNNREFSDFWLDDASFLRVKNINLNYNFSDVFCQKIGMNALGVYVSAQNLYTFTKFHGVEVDTATDPLTGVPQPRSWTFGFKATF